MVREVCELGMINDNQIRNVLDAMDTQENPSIRPEVPTLGIEAPEEDCACYEDCGCPEPCACGICICGSDDCACCCGQCLTEDDEEDGEEGEEQEESEEEPEDSSECYEDCTCPPEGCECPPCPCADGKACCCSCTAA